MLTVEAVVTVEGGMVHWYGMRSPTAIKSCVRVELASGDCSCATFRLTKTCIHSTTIKRGKGLWTHCLTPDYKVEVCDDPLPIMMHGEWGAILNDGDIDSALVQLPPVPKGRHAYEVLTALSAKASLLGPCKADEDMTTSRVRVEMMEAYHYGLPLTADSVLEAEVKEIVVSPPLGAPVESGLSTSVAPEKIKNEEPPKVKKDVTIWEKTKKPDDFYVEKDVWEALLWCAVSGGNALLLGPTGAGKSSLVYKVAQALGKPIEPINFGATSEARITLVGATHYDATKGTFFNESRFVKAVRKADGIVLLDELTRATKDAFNLIMPLLDGQGYISLDEKEDGAVIYKGELVSFIGTANVGFEYTGTDALDRALLDRFRMKIELSYPPIGEEVKLVTKRFPKCEHGLIASVAECVEKQRKMAKAGDFQTTISTRMLLDCANALQAGVKAKTAIRFTILGCFSSSGDAESERMKCATIFQKAGRDLI